MSKSDIGVKIRGDTFGDLEFLSDTYDDNPTQELSTSDVESIVDESKNISQSSTKIQLKSELSDREIPTRATSPLSRISENNVFESLHIKKITTETLSIKYEGYQYEFNESDLHNFKPTKEGGYGKVFPVSKTGRRYFDQDKILSDNSKGQETTRTTKFMIKCTKEFVDGGCNSGLEIKVLNDLAKLESSMSPYLSHVAVKGLQETQFFTIMKCYDYDLNELIFFFKNICDGKISETTFIKNQFIQKKSAFHKKFQLHIYV